MVCVLNVQMYNIVYTQLHIHVHVHVCYDVLDTWNGDRGREGGRETQLLQLLCVSFLI